jgi:hypothetical protein
MAAAFCMMLCWLLLLALQVTLTARGLEPAGVAGETYGVFSALAKLCTLGIVADMFEQVFAYTIQRKSKFGDVQTATPEKGFCAPALICCLCSNTTP